MMWTVRYQTGAGDYLQHWLPDEERARTIAQELKAAGFRNVTMFASGCSGCAA